MMSSQPIGTGHIIELPAICLHRVFVFRKYCVKVLNSWPILIDSHHLQTPTRVHATRVASITIAIKVYLKRNWTPTIYPTLVHDDQHLFAILAHQRVHFFLPCTSTPRQAEHRRYRDGLRKQFCFHAATSFLSFHRYFTIFRAGGGVRPQKTSMQIAGAFFGVEKPSRKLQGPFSRSKTPLAKCMGLLQAWIGPLRFAGGFSGAGMGVFRSRGGFRAGFRLLPFRGVLRGDESVLADHAH